MRDKKEAWRFQASQDSISRIRLNYASFIIPFASSSVIVMLYYFFACYAAISMTFFRRGFALESHILDYIQFFSVSLSCHNLLSWNDTPQDPNPVSVLASAPSVPARSDIQLSVGLLSSFWGIFRSYPLLRWWALRPIGLPPWHLLSLWDPTPSQNGSTVAWALYSEVREL